MSEKKPKKYPDNVVWSEDKGFYAHILDYPTNVGAPKFSSNNILSWKEEKILKTNHYFQRKQEELKKLYLDFMQELEWNSLIYSAIYNFQPIVGQHYFLYRRPNNELFLSIIEPNQWKQEFVGEFVLNSENVWSKID